MPHALDSADPGAPMLVIVNARVWTNDPRKAWADAVLVRGERVLAVGSSAELRKRAGRAARVVDARGLLARPVPEGHVLAPGSPATLVLLARGASDPPAPIDDDVVVLSLVDGRVERDRDGLAR